MPVVAVSEVDVHPPAGNLLDFRLEQPYSDQLNDVYAITFTGWVMGERVPPVKLQLRGGGTDPRDIPLGMPRPDLKEAFPHVRWATSNSGFNVSVSVLRLPDEFDLELVVVFNDSSEAALARIRGRHDFPGALRGGLEPIMVTTLGRTGSTWMTQLLGGHPEIITYPPFRHEVRLASYWLEVFLALSEPASYLQGVQALVSQQHWFLGRERHYDEESTDEEMLRWFGRAQVESLSAFCKSRIDEFYAMLSERDGGKRPRYFAEKALPDMGGQIMTLRGLYPGVREIVLVRDFRDMLSSILAYNRKRGYPHFNRHLADSDEDYVRRFLGPDVMKLAEAWEQRADTAHLVRYEDLVTESRPTLRALLEYLELESSDESLDLMLGMDGRAPAEGQHGHRTVAVATDSIGRWRSDLDPGLAAVCEEGFGPALERFRYETG